MVGERSTPAHGSRPSDHLAAGAFLSSGHPGQFSFIKETRWFARLLQFGGTEGRLSLSFGELLGVLTSVISVIARLSFSAMNQPKYSMHSTACSTRNPEDVRAVDPERLITRTMLTICQPGRPRRLQSRIIDARLSPSNHLRWPSQLSFGNWLDSKTSAPMIHDKRGDF